jgi:hypothetical protein
MAMESGIRFRKTPVKANDSAKSVLTSHMLAPSLNATILPRYFPNGIRW